MIFIIAGVLVVVIGFVWMLICASAGWSPAWWYFEWSQFKLILGAHLLTGGLLIGVGLRRLVAHRRRPGPPTEHQ